MSDDLFALICDIDSEELSCGHDHSLPPARTIHTIFDPEDNNMGDEAFVSIDAYL